MVGCGIKDNELARLLLGFHVGDPMCMKQRWGQEDLLVAHERMAGVVQVWEHALEKHQEAGWASKRLGEDDTPVRSYE